MVVEEKQNAAIPRQTPDLKSKWVGNLTSNTLMNSESLDPRSLSMACLVDKLHPRGPGVKSFLSWGENHHISIIMYIIYISGCIPGGTV